MNISSPQKTPKQAGSQISCKGLIRLGLIIPVMGAILFISAGTLNWWEAWAYSAVGLATILISRVILIRKNPDLARERSEAGGRDDTKSWDKFLMPLTALFLPMISWIVVGLDHRYGWSPDLPDPIQIAALVVLILGNVLGSWAMLANTFFSSQVRIQHDRGHKVVNSGPYRFVRHPGYAGGLLSWLATPFFFSSVWLAVPMVLAIAASILRTALEDHTLQEELPGYSAYTKEVPYRLIPGIW